MGIKLTASDASDPSRHRFVVDLMLMRLGRWLRLMGEDVANPEEGSDWQIRDQARREHRTVITRDKILYESCLKANLPCILIRSSQIEEQLLEMARTGVPLRLDPRRCTLCNGELEKNDGAGEQWKCRRCGKIYWKGSHWTKMGQLLLRIDSRKEDNLVSGQENRK